MAKSLRFLAGYDEKNIAAEIDFKEAIASLPHSSILRGQFVSFISPCDARHCDVSYSWKI